MTKVDIILIWQLQGDSISVYYMGTQQNFGPKFYNISVLVPGSILADLS